MRTVINERYSVRERGPLSLGTFPPHIFPGATHYQIHVGRVSLSFAGRGSEHPSNTVLRVGHFGWRETSITVVAPRRFTNDSWKGYIEVERRLP